jgi:hypothetical protein
MTIECSLLKHVIAEGRCRNIGTTRFFLQKFVEPAKKRWRETFWGGILGQIWTHSNRPNGPEACTSSPKAEVDVDLGSYLPQWADCCPSSSSSLQAKALGFSERAPGGKAIWAPSHFAQTSRLPVQLQDYLICLLTLPSHDRSHTCYVRDWPPQPYVVKKQGVVLNWWELLSS